MSEILDNMFIFKAFDSSDGAAVDEQGRFIIFRSINGRITPLHVSSVDYAEHLAKNGVNIDPADQNQMAVLDEQLQALAEIGQQDPRYQARLEQALVKKIALATGYQQQYQQKVSQTDEQTQQLREVAKQHETAGTLQSRVDKTTDMGWGDYLDKYIAGFGASHSKNSDEYKTLVAYGAVLKESLHLARQGRSGNSVSVHNIIKKLIQDYGNTDFVKKLAQDTGEDEIDTRLRLAKGLRILNAIYDDEDNTFGTQLKHNFNKVYNKMYSDFTDESSLNLRNLKYDGKDLESLRGDDVGENLPSKISTNELNRVHKEFENIRAKGGAVNQVANQVYDHLLKRLIDTFPGGEQRYNTLALSGNLLGSLKDAHQRGFNIAEQEKDFQLHKDPSSLVNSMLEEANQAISGGSDTAYLSAMKKITKLLGEMDGYQLHAENPRASARDFNTRRQQIMMGNRRKSGHPSIESLALYPSVRENAGIDNSVLRLPSDTQPQPKPNVPPAANFDLDMPDDETSSVNSDSSVSNDLVFDPENKSFKTEDGKYRLAVNGENLDLYDEGKKISSTPRSQFATKEDLLSHFSNSIGQHRQIPAEVSESSPTTDNTDNNEPPETVKFAERKNFYGDYSSDENGLITTPDGYTAKYIADETGNKYLQFNNPEGNEITAIPTDGSKEMEQQALDSLTDIRAQNKFPISQQRMKFSDEAVQKYGKAYLQELQHSVETAGGIIKPITGSSAVGVSITLPNKQQVLLASQAGTSTVLMKLGKQPAKELSKKEVMDFISVKEEKPETKPEVSTELVKTTQEVENKPMVQTKARVSMKPIASKTKLGEVLNSAKSDDAKLVGSKISFSPDHELDFGNEEDAAEIMKNPSLLSGFEKIKSFLPTKGGIDIEVSGGKDMMYISLKDYEKNTSPTEKDKLFKEAMASAGVQPDENVLTALRYYVKKHHSPTENKFLDKPKSN